MGMKVEIDESFDFGFTTHGGDEFIDVKQQNEKAQLMYDAIMPLLNNLLKDADKNEVIKWPNRREKIEKFIEKLQSILNS